MIASGKVYPCFFGSALHMDGVEEFYQAFRPDLMTSPEIMKGRISDLIRLNIQRNEDDNISAILVKTH